MKKVLLIGGSGSWGNELCKKLLLRQDVEEVRIFSRNEFNQVMMSRKFTDMRVKFIVGDVRDYQAVYDACAGIDTVFLLSALKHVPICEEQPLEAVKTNINGTDNVIRACIAQNVSKCVDVSTDKACSPTNLYGATKLVGEKLILNANKLGKTKFLCIRAGNVLGSAGSVVPLFIDQIRSKNEITITCSNMTRYFMSLPEAIELLIIASECEILPAEMIVMKMPSCTIGDLAKAVIKLYGNADTNIKEIGMRTGEKMHEMLLNEHESLKAYFFGRDYYIVSQTTINLPPVDFLLYSSEGQTLMNEVEIINMLKKGGF